MEGIRRALVLGLVLIAGTAIEHAASVSPRLVLMTNFNIFVKFLVLYNNNNVCI